VPAACLACTIEYRGQADATDELAEADARGLFRFFQRRGMMEGDPGHLPTTLCDATQLEACDILRSPVAGIVTYRRPLGAYIARRVVAEIVDPLSDDPTAAHADQSRPKAHCCRGAHKMVARRQRCKVVGREPLAIDRMLLED
jgi:predicted deacylase